ncbi:MAG: Lrp/AsnC family transcriptional regulator [Candidatus Diapherotrites archaeon]|nr:Lrp/AsnC family transcriptional regulator [Candidatus Diapherotrites archaeon]
MELDKTDLLILNELTENSRLSFRALAKKLGLSTNTVLTRIGKMEKQGIIRKYTVLLDYEKLGFELQAIIHLKIAKGKLVQVEEKIAKIPNVQAVYDVTGTIDAILIAKFKNRSGLDSFLKKIQSYDFIEDTETQIILRSLKEDVAKP